MSESRIESGKVSRAFDLSGRVAIVTGAARGIGRSAAALLADAGADVLAADIHADPLEETAAAIAAATGRRVLSHIVDVSSREQVDAMIARAVEEWERLDVMVNNAGIITDTLVLELTEEEVDRVHAVNFKGVLFGCQAAARVMIKQGSGSIINVASGAIDVPAPTVAAYATAKAAVAQLSRTLAAEIGRTGVRVNVVAPGWIDTPMNERHVVVDGAIDPGRREQQLNQRASMSMLGLTGEPDDIGFGILYLASDAARFYTGNVVRPNGGATTPW
jgi:3-oxoacyl-[acyl-carrier protein] reductase